MFRRLAAITVLGVIAAVATTMATGALTSTQGAVDVCVGKSGTIRVGTDCKTNEYPLTIGGGSTVFRTVQVTQDFNQPQYEFLGEVDVPVTCNAGERVVGGGGTATNELWGYTGYLVASRPSADNLSWIARFSLPDGVSHATAYAICAS